MNEMQNAQLNLPPLYVPKRTEPATVKKEIIHLGTSLSFETLPEYLKDNPAFTAHLNKVVDMQKRKMQITELRQSAAQELIQTQLQQIQQLQQLQQLTQSTRPNAYHYQNAWEDQATMNSVVSFDFRIEPVQNPAQPYVVSKEEQLAIASKFLSKLDRVIAQSEKALQR